MQHSVSLVVNEMSAYRKCEVEKCISQFPALRHTLMACITVSPPLAVGACVRPSIVDYVRPYRTYVRSFSGVFNHGFHSKSE